jgi:hypothetical protein
LVNRFGAKPVSANLFWFSDEQWSKVAPHCRPTNLARNGTMIDGF